MPQEPISVKNSNSTNSPNFSFKESSSAECPAHGLLTFFCWPCRKPVSGSCIAVGEHDDKPIVLVRGDIALEKMKASFGYVEPLRKVLERSERALMAGKEASERLSSTASDIRQQIRKSAEKAVNMVEECKKGAPTLCEWYRNTAFEVIGDPRWRDESSSRERRRCCEKRANSPHIDKRWESPWACSL